MPITVYSGQVVGLDAQLISVEVDISPGLHIFSIVGLADKEVQESRERISAAIKNLGALPPHKKSQRVIVNLAPANIKKEGPAFDLPIALGYLLASNQISFNPTDKLFLGELSLEGKIRPVSGILPIALSGRAAGFSSIILPKGNGKETSLLEGINIYEVEDLDQTIKFLEGNLKIEPFKPKNKKISREKGIDFAFIKGQEKAKRALEIAAAGGHGVLLSGPPGAGKTLLAQALPSILPQMNFNELLEVSKIYSIAGLLNENNPYMQVRPFRHPHHTASYTAIIGGGTVPQPGEVTLAHRGVLFLDELPEFDRRVVESLREPLEEHKVTIARAQGTQTFPAQFTLVASMNPCPCGHFGNPKIECTCSASFIQKYRRKISGPLMDRIDLHVETPAIEFETLESPESESSDQIRNRVEFAREKQKERFTGLKISTNSEMGIYELKKFSPVSAAIKGILKSAHERFRLSARSYHRILKISRTIADLDNSPEIFENHVAEALHYRPAIE